MFIEVEMLEIAGLKVDAALAAFIENEVLAPLGRDVGTFWQGLAALTAQFAPRNQALLARRDALQAQIDAWHIARAGKPWDASAYAAFLTEIGYLVPEPGDFAVSTTNVDDEIAVMAGPQLVVPVLNARFVLNAANARWGSLYDAWYGTDALDAPAARPGGYDAARGAAVIRAGRDFLDRTVPMADGDWADWDGQGIPALRDPDQLVAQNLGALLLAHHNLHIEVVLDRAHPIGARDSAGIADIILESALTTIVDLEDSIAAVDAADKLAAYRNWLGLIRGDLSELSKKAARQLPAR